MFSQQHLTQTMINFQESVMTMKHAEEIHKKHLWNLMALLLLFTLAVSIIFYTLEDLKLP